MIILFLTLIIVLSKKVKIIFEDRLPIEISKNDLIKAILKKYKVSYAKDNVSKFYSRINVINFILILINNPFKFLSYICKIIFNKKEKLSDDDYQLFKFHYQEINHVNIKDNEDVELEYEINLHENINHILEITKTSNFLISEEFKFILFLPKFSGSLKDG